MQVIYFGEEVAQRSVERLLSRLQQANSSRYVHVDSPGGTFDFFSVLAPAIERQGIITLSGNVRSAAILLYLLGNTRQAFPDSSFFFHEVRAMVGPRGGITVADLEEVEEYEKEMSGRQREGYQEWCRSMQAAQNWFLIFVSQRTGVPIPTFLSLMRSEATLSANEAIRYGIAHEVVPEDFLHR